MLVQSSYDVLINVNRKEIEQNNLKLKNTPTFLFIGLPTIGVIII